MNRSIIIYMPGQIISTEAIFMTLSVITAIVYRESIGFIYLDVVVACDLPGFLCTRKKSCTRMFFVREGPVTASLGWIVLSSFGCTPFVINGEISHITDAMSEIVSGFTTTGSSIIPKVEDISHAILMWRSLSHWIGGMGILVFILATLPMAGDYSIHIVRAESPGPSVGKLMSKVQITAEPLHSICFCMTIVMIIFLLLGKMLLLNNICMSFEAAGTGDFVYRSSGQANYMVYQQAVITISMLPFSVNFNVYYPLLICRPRDAGRCEELRRYLAVVTIVILFITINIRNLFLSLFVIFHQATFRVSSVTTTIRYSTIDYNSRPEFSRIVLLLIIFIGACAGSMDGGMKASHVMIALKEIKKEMASVIHPRSVRVLKFEGESLKHNIPRSPDTYTIVYFIIFGIFILIVSPDDYSFMTSFSAAATNLDNVGPGMSMMGPSSNYSMMSYLSKTVLIFDILAGRLELFPALVPLSPGTWERS